MLPGRYRPAQFSFLLFYYGRPIDILFPVFSLSQVQSFSYLLLPVTRLKTKRISSWPVLHVNPVTILSIDGLTWLQDRTGHLDKRKERPDHAPAFLFSFNFWCMRSGSFLLVNGVQVKDVYCHPVNFSYFLFPDDRNCFDLFLPSFPSCDTSFIFLFISVTGKENEVKEGRFPEKKRTETSITSLLFSFSHGDACPVSFSTSLGEPSSWNREHFFLFFTGSSIPRPFLPYFSSSRDTIIIFLSITVSRNDEIEGRKEGVIVQSQDYFSFI